MEIDLMKLLEITEQRIRQYHDSLWKEETHYTWISYILAGALLSVFVLVIQNQDKVGTFLAWVTFSISVILAFVGILISLIGRNVVKREKENFDKTMKVRKKINRALVEKSVDLKSIYDLGDYTLDEGEQKQEGESRKTITGYFLATMTILKFVFILSIALSISMLVPNCINHRIYV